MITLYRKANFYKPLHVEIKGKEHEISSFILYNEDGVVLKEDRGYLESGVEPRFEFDISKKLKEKFDKKVAYILKSTSSPWGDRVRYDLYIHTDLVGLKEPVYSIDYGHIVMATYKTDIEGFAFKQSVSYLDKGINIVKREIKELGEKLDDYLLNSKMLKEIITKLQELQVKLEEEENWLGSYTVEDYLRDKEKEGESNETVGN